MSNSDQILVAGPPLANSKAVIAGFSLSLCIDIGFVSDQQFNQVFVSANYCLAQRCPVVVVFDIYPAFVSDQQFRHVLVALLRCKEQRRIALVVFAENEIRIDFEQCFDFLKIASPRNIKKTQMCSNICLALRLNETLCHPSNMNHPLPSFQ